MTPLCDIGVPIPQPSRPREARRPFIPRLLVGRFAACRRRAAEREGGNQAACSCWQGVFA
jgi:hypothetical protein